MGLLAALPRPGRFGSAKIPLSLALQHAARIRCLPSVSALIAGEVALKLMRRLTVAFSGGTWAHKSS
jgi:hypothetical protein